VGSDTVTATYSGDGNHGGSTGSVSESVSHTTSSTVVSASPNPAIYGQSVTLTATVAPVDGGNATGTVTFYSNGNSLGTAPVSGNQASLTLSTPGAGRNSITAIYSGDSNVGGSTSHALVQIVSKAGSAVTSTSSLNPAFVNQSITYTATVTSQDSGAVTGTVTFTSGTTTLGVVTLVNGQASVTTSYSKSGTQSMTAKYSGDANNVAGMAAPLKEVVNKYTSSTTLASSLNPSVVGQSVTFTATVSTNSGVPTGSVTFKSGTTILGTAPLTGNTASLSISTLAAGNHAVSATYSGDTTYPASSSAVLTQVVDKP
jgi:hypothetical protein